MILQGDCLIKLKELEENSVDSIVTDPPYHLVSIVKRFGKKGSAPAKFGTDGAFSRASKGFMGKTWDGVDEDGNGIAYNVDMWKECLRVLKPGGHLLSFGGTRTYHRMACAIEDAGFIIRDMIEWIYGSGFPKSHNIGKAVDKLQGNEREITGSYKVPDIKGDAYGTMNEKQGGSYKNIEVNKTKGTSKWEGWGTALKPAHEPICCARKPLEKGLTVAQNVLKYGTGGINIDESRVDFGDNEPDKRIGTDTLANGQSAGNVRVGADPKGKNIKMYKDGRFPANLIHDNSEEVRECFPETKGEIGRVGRKFGGNYEASSYKMGVVTKTGIKDSGNASRFFKSIIYQPKASKSERNKGCEGLEDKELAIANKQIYERSGSREQPKSDYTKRKNNHPTVKPIALMKYLITMVTPKGGVVLDPFMGSGSTGVACAKNGFDFIGIEMEPEYIEIAKARIEYAQKELKQKTLI